MIAWLNADAGHRHSITLVDNNTKNIKHLIITMLTQYLYLLRRQSYLTKPFQA
jgi:hypothetical protein